jgi:hypothetical protein
MMQSRGILVQEVLVCTPRLVMLIFVRRLVVCMVYIWISSHTVWSDVIAYAWIDLFLLFSVCDDACREFVLDQSSGLLVCTISGHCFERFLSPGDEWDTCDTVSPDACHILSFCIHKFSNGTGSEWYSQRIIPCNPHLVIPTVIQSVCIALSDLVPITKLCLFAILGSAARWCDWWGRAIHGIWTIWYLFKFYLLTSFFLHHACCIWF